MPVVMIPSNSNDNLGARCRNQRNEEHKGEKTKHKFLHNPSDAQPRFGVVERLREIIQRVQNLTPNNTAAKRTHLYSFLLTPYPLPSHTLGRYNQARNRWPIKS